MTETHTPAKRGDLVMVPIVSSTTYALGSGRGTERRTVYALGVVTSVTRDGFVKAAERPRKAPWPWKLAPERGRCKVLPAARLACSVQEVVLELARDFLSEEDAIEAVRPFAKKAAA